MTNLGEAVQPGRDDIGERVRRKAREIAALCEEACGIRHIAAEGLARAAMFSERRRALEEACDLIHACTVGTNDERLGARIVLALRTLPFAREP